MKPKIAIGITTYLDISPHEFGERLFNAYLDVSDRITPNRANIWGEAHDVSTASEFGRFWATQVEFRTYEDKGKGALVGKHDSLIGCEWRHIGAPSGGGNVCFRPPDDQSRSNSIIIEHNFAPRIDWRLLFKELIEIFVPSYAMLHMFPEPENEKPDGQLDRFERFDRPFGGEEHFTSWKTNSGEWRKPDKWQLKERRQYRHLPELSWANFLGVEFAGLYDQSFLMHHAVDPLIKENGLYFQTTENLSDVVSEYSLFQQSRSNLKSAFEPNFFRR